jgi:hypothetical protein
VAESGARLLSVGVLADFKAALVKFGEQAKVGVIEAGADMQRTMNRLQTEVMSYWQHEEKLWTRKVAEAKSELYKAQLQSQDQRPSLVLERKALAAAQRRLENAQQKIQKVRYWSRMLEKEMMLCRGQLQQMERALDADLPRVSAQVDRMMQSIEAYLRVKPTPTAAADAADTGDEAPITAPRAASREKPAPVRADDPGKDEQEHEPIE